MFVCCKSSWVIKYVGKIPKYIFSNYIFSYPAETGVDIANIEFAFIYEGINANLMVINDTTRCHQRKE